MDLGLCQTGLWRARKNDNAEKRRVAFLHGPFAIFHALLQILCGTPGAHRAINHFATTYATALGESPSIEAAAPRPRRAVAASEAAGIYARIARTG